MGCSETNFANSSCLQKQLQPIEYKHHKTCHALEVTLAHATHTGSTTAATAQTNLTKLMNTNAYAQNSDKRPATVE